MHRKLTRLHRGRGLSQRLLLPGRSRITTSRRPRAMGTCGLPATGPTGQAATTGWMAHGSNRPTRARCGPPATGGFGFGDYMWNPGYWGLGIGYYAAHQLRASDTSAPASWGGYWRGGTGSSINGEYNHLGFHNGTVYNQSGCRIRRPARRRGFRARHSCRIESRRHRGKPRLGHQRSKHPSRGVAITPRSTYNSGGATAATLVPPRPHAATPALQPHAVTPAPRPHAATPALQPHAVTPALQPHAATPAAGSYGGGARSNSGGGARRQWRRWTRRRRWRTSCKTEPNLNTKG